MADSYFANSYWASGYFASGYFGDITVTPATPTTNTGVWPRVKRRSKRKILTAIKLFLKAEIDE